MPLNSLKNQLLRRRRTENITPDAEKDFEYALTQDDVNRLTELVFKRVNSQGHNSFVVHPPQAVLDDPSILQSDSIVEILSDSVFTVVFQDGTTELLGLHELIAFIHQLGMLKVGMSEVMSSRDEGAEIKKVELSFAIHMKELMRPEVVKLLLGKIDFSDLGTDVGGHRQSVTE